MIICYARSSSLKDWEYCPQKYFINYNLGIKEPPNKKAVMGTITHKVLEWLALAKLNWHPEKISFYDDSLNEQIEMLTQDLTATTILEDKTVDEINKTRSNKSIYKTVASINYGTERKGYLLINDLIIRAFQYYSTKYKYDWTTSDLKNCGNWTWMALEWNNGNYDPRNLKIVSPERSFDIEIEQEWAKYDFVSGNKNISGNFSIKGTIDLITEVNSDTLEIIDWKTGQRYDWAKGEEKTYEKLCNDVQLALYHYAATKLYPHINHILFTIFFIRDGGPFTVTFDSDNLNNVEEILKQHFTEVKNVRLPKMLSNNQSDFRCTKLCSYYKNKWPNSDQNVCRFIHNEIKRIGMDAVIDRYKQDNYEFNQYQSPGT